MSPEKTCSWCYTYRRSQERKTAELRAALIVARNHISPNTDPTDAKTTLTVIDAALAQSADATETSAKR